MKSSCVVHISRKTHVSVRASVKLDYCLPSRELSQRMPRAPRRNQIFSDCRLLPSVLPFIHSFIHSFFYSFILLFIHSFIHSFLLSFLRFSVAARHRPTFVHWLQVISYTPAGSAGMMNDQVWWTTRYDGVQVWWTTEWTVIATTGGCTL